ncbi:hypothetical protein MKW98_003662 [Papaver atlanticum]|uniref:C2H2-type domain-containing protein n=1 Tax=Papaver atlanticum TaxID=357466 RepID=A0AAD4XEU7_9MAGN|nr:hypothetical protein MKW98_003662 [Papaver atlanticum]
MNPMEKMEEEGRFAEKKQNPRDIRCFYCEFCGICRSKKSLIVSHLQTHHNEEIEMNGIDEKEEAKSDTTC